MVLPALKLSLVVSAVATVTVAILGTWTGWILARRRFVGREWLDALFDLPLVLPPTVTGYYLLVLLGNRGPLGSLPGVSIPFSWLACAIAATVMAFPLMARAARVAFEELDPRHQLAAASLGHGRISIFLRVVIPLARRGLAAGVVLSFARALGEFGATLMLAGNIPGRTQTLPLAIYEAVVTGEDRTALLLSALLTSISVVVIVAAGRLGEGEVIGFDLDVALRRETRAGTPFRLEAKFSTPPGIAVIFGPSGAGKSSLLHAILGALVPERGRIGVAGRTLFDSAAGIDLPTTRRGMGMVFQDALLFPHMTARQNVAFGVRHGAAERTASEYLERAGALDLAGRRPAELSGGQRQRVALARALAAGPRGLLLDEPFSALDAAAREALGKALLELQAASGIPFLHVTHDLAEALRLGNLLVLIDEGRVQQVGPPASVVATPGTLAAARAVGTENRFTGKVVGHRVDEGCSEVDLGGTRVVVALLGDPPGAEIALGLRAEDVLLSLEPLSRTSARNLLPATIERIADLGVGVELRVRTPVPMRVLVTPASVAELALAPGKPVYLLIKAAAFHRLV